MRFGFFIFFIANVFCSLPQDLNPQNDSSGKRTRSLSETELERIFENEIKENPGKRPCNIDRGEINTELFFGLFNDGKTQSSAGKSELRSPSSLRSFSSLHVPLPKFDENTINFSSRSTLKPIQKKPINLGNKKQPQRAAFNAVIPANDTDINLPFGQLSIRPNRKKNH